MQNSEQNFFKKNLPYDFSPSLWWSQLGCKARKIDENWILKSEGVAKSDREKSELGRGTPGLGEILSFPYSTSLPPLILKFDVIAFFGLYS